MQESKLESISQSTWREIGGPKLDQFVFAPAKGTARGMIIGWSGVNLVGKLEKVGVFSLTVEFRDKRDNFIWRCTSVYGPTARTLKRSFWEELRSCGGDPLIPWVICGDFNAIFSVEDKPSGAHNLQRFAMRTGLNETCSYVNHQRLV